MNIDTIMSILNIIGCPPENYGLMCRHACDCQNGATCDPVNGECTCTPGWRGTDCAEGKVTTSSAAL